MEWKIHLLNARMSNVKSNVTHPKPELFFNIAASTKHTTATNMMAMPMILKSDDHE